MGSHDLGDKTNSHPPTHPPFHSFPFLSLYKIPLRLLPSIMWAWYRFPNKLFTTCNILPLVTYCWSGGHQSWVHGPGNWRPNHDLLRATSHTRLRACDHYTSSTLIGGKGGASPSSLHTMHKGPTEYVNARWM